MKTTTNLLLALAMMAGIMVSDALAVTNNATDGTAQSISNAIAISNPGDTVQIPAGTWTWTNTGVVLSGITLRGAGTNNTYILFQNPGYFDAAPYQNGTVIVLPTTNALTRITGITFGDNGSVGENATGLIYVDGSSCPPTVQCRIDHCVFSQLVGHDIVTFNNFECLIDHNAFFLGNPTNIANGGPTTGAAFITKYVNHYGPIDSYGDYPWTIPSPLGATNVTVFEDNWVSNEVPSSSSCAVHDGEYGDSSVTRHNVFCNTFWGNHGNDTSGRVRSSRSFEIYNNTFTDDQAFYTAMDFRGGSGVIYSNVFNGYGAMISVENFRNVEAIAPFLGVDGTNAWDAVSSVPALTLTNAYATNSYTTNIIVAANVNWIPNQWVGYVVSDPAGGWYNAVNSDPVPPPSFGLVQGNTTNTLTLARPKDFIPQFTNGDAIKLYWVSNTIDKFGNGPGDLIGDINTGSGYITTNMTGNGRLWPRQSREMVYGAYNTLAGTNIGITVGGYSSIVAGLDYTNGLLPLAYTPLVYPHPLNTDSSVVTTNTPVPIVVTTDTNATALAQLQLAVLGLQQAVATLQQLQASTNLTYFQTTNGIGTLTIATLPLGRTGWTNNTQVTWVCTLTCAINLYVYDRSGSVDAVLKNITIATPLQFRIQPGSWFTANYVAGSLHAW